MFFMKPKFREKFPPSISWEGFLGINADSYDGLRRSEGFVFVNVIGDNIYG